MRVRIVAALGVTAAALLALPACSANSTGAKPTAPSPPAEVSRPMLDMVRRCRRPR
ncbi:MULTISPECIES: hypothetical protein [Streptomyces]|uniref:hypothetical protein n=1 Tax=Streptomyces TaxID=1883 RepID=UPI00341BD409